MRNNILQCSIAGVFIGLAWNIVDCGSAAQPRPEQPITVKQKLSQKVKFYARCITFSPDGKLLAVASQSRIAPESATGIISIWDAGTGIEKQNLQVEKLVAALAWSPKERRLIAASASIGKNDRLTCLNLETGQQVLTAAMPLGTWRVAYHPGGKEFAVASFNRKAIEIRDSEKGAVIRTINQSGVFDVAFAPNGGKTLATACDDKTVRIIDTNSGELLLTLKGHKKYVESIGWSASGERLASGSADKSAIVWNAKSGGPICIIPVGYHVSKVALSPNGKWVAVGGNVNGKITLHDAATGREVFVLTDSRSGTNGLTFNQDGTLLAASWGSNVGVWEIREAKAPAEKGK